MKRNVAPALTILALFGLWQLYTVLFHVPAYILPSPVDTARALWEYRDLLFLHHLPITALEVIVGFGLSVVLGTALGVVMHVWRPIAQALYPLVIASQTVPVIAISPIFLWWFGYSLSQKVAVILLFTFFPVAVATFDGLRTADPDLIDLMRSMGAPRWRILRMVELPSALPLFFSGVKMAAAVSVVGATIGEWLGGEAGLGVFGRRMNNNWKAPGLFASVVLLSLLGIILFLSMSWVERRVLRYRERR
jgi:putative hydroxymethylpyrimidine transport system permease protein